jgi:hypothetical protein
MSSDDRELKIVLDHVKQNDVNFVSAQESLNPFARREIKDMTIENYKLFRNDLRRNHFAWQNHNILAKILIQSFKTGQSFSYKKMKTNIITESETHLSPDENGKI